jgi:hypothetical protein
MVFGPRLPFIHTIEHLMDESFQIYLYSNIGELTVAQVNAAVVDLMLTNLKDGEDDQYSMTGYTSVEEIPVEPDTPEHALDFDVGQWYHDGVLLRTQVVTPADNGKGFAETNLTLDRRFINPGMAGMSLRVLFKE